jgi:hypothetical protein
MYLFTIPAHKDKLTVIKIGGYQNAYYKVTINEMEIIRDLVVNEELSIEETKKLLLVTDVQVFPKISSYEEYLFLIRSEYELTNQDKLFWKETIEKATNDDDMKIFMLDALNLKRIKKSLLPFI